MRIIDRAYVDGAFVQTHGRETADLINPSSEQVIGQVVLGDDTDARAASPPQSAPFRASPAPQRPSASPCCTACVMRCWPRPTS
jgi:acyl-CoA reductase-like NAD-dependent aldehyde dehydrogenase